MAGRDIYLTGRDIYFQKGHNCVTNYQGDKILIMCTNPKEDTKFVEAKSSKMEDTKGRKLQDIYGSKL